MAFEAPATILKLPQCLQLIRPGTYKDEVGKCWLTVFMHQVIN